MEHILTTEGLPTPLADAVQPWINIVETATDGMGDELCAVAASATVGVRRRAVLTPSLETAIEDARIATAVLASVLDWERSASPTTHSDTRAALEALISLLRTARPNERAKGIGLGW